LQDGLQREQIVPPVVDEQHFCRPVETRHALPPPSVSTGP
jgi:hypothetical protein